MPNFEISPPLEQTPTQKFIFADEPPGAYSRIYGIYHWIEFNFRMDDEHRLIARYAQK